MSKADALWTGYYATRQRLEKDLFMWLKALLSGNVNDIVFWQDAAVTHLDATTILYSEFRRLSLAKRRRRAA